MVFAGKAHPQDEEAKHAAQGLFTFEREPAAMSRIAFLDNYSLSIAEHMVAGATCGSTCPGRRSKRAGRAG